MNIDLLLKLDDDLSTSVSQWAADAGVSIEEWLRRALLQGVGRPYERPLPDYDMVMRPIVTVDLRT